LLPKDQNIKIVIFTAGLFLCGSQLPISRKNTGASFVMHEEERNACRVWAKKSPGKTYFEDVGVDGNLI
jgi:hypothetical protein